MGDVDDDDGSGGFAGVPVQVGEVSEAACKVVVTVEDCAKDLMGFENQLTCTYGEGKRNLQQGHPN